MTETKIAQYFSHLFFAVAMLLLITRIQKSKVARARGWRYIQIGSLFFLLWNINALVVTVVRGRIPAFLFDDVGRFIGNVLVLPARIIHVGRILDPILFILAMYNIFLAVRYFQIATRKG